MKLLIYDRYALRNMHYFLAMKNTKANHNGKCYIINTMDIHFPFYPTILETKLIEANGNVEIYIYLS